MMRHRNLFAVTNVRRLGALRFQLVAMAIVLGAETTACAAIIPIFYNSLDSDGAISSADYGANSAGTPQNVANHTYTPGVSGNALQSTSSSTNAGGYASWSDAAVTAIFTTAAGWNSGTSGPGNGITIDLYFQGTYSNITSSSGVSEGLWYLGKRNNNTGGGGDRYLFASVISSTAQPGRLRFAFSNDSTNQYKFTLNNNANSGEISTAGTQDLPLSDGVTYHLTMSLGNGELNVYLDDVGGNTYSNASPVYTNNTFSAGFNWQLPTAGAVSGSGGASKQTREMDIGIRGFGNTSGSVNNFGGSLRNGNWVDEVSIYNGVYSPADLAVPEPSAMCLMALGLLVSQVMRRRP
jgi:hypothetical protein